jgi:hypothetical protein
MLKSYKKQLILNLLKEVESAGFELMESYSMCLINSKRDIRLKAEYKDQLLDKDLVKSLNRFNRKLMADGWDVKKDVSILIITSPGITRGSMRSDLYSFMAEVNHKPVQKKGFFSFLYKKDKPFYMLDNQIECLEITIDIGLYNTRY